MMYIQSVKIENFRAISDLELTFDPKFNLIIGDNGVGKTSVLEAIAVGLGGLISSLEEVKTINFTKDDIRRVGEKLGDGSYNIHYQTPLSVNCQLQIDQEILSFSRIRKSLKSSRTSLSNHKVSALIAQRSNDSNCILPLISYQSAGRMWVQKREKWENVFKSNFSRAIGYLNCLDSESDMKMFTNWCKRMEQISWQQDKKISEYEAVKSAVSLFMDTLMEKSTQSTIFYDKRTEELMYQDGYEMTPLRLMSTGYRSLVGMVGDIAYRMAVLNPQLLDQVIDQTPGIVLIDELDLHLHPHWQWKVIKALQVTFPKIQFIATTHSPILIASMENKKILTLKEEIVDNYKLEIESTPLKDARGWALSDILSKYMNTKDRANEIIAKLNMVEELTLKQFNHLITDEETERLEALKDQLVELLPEGDASLELAQLEPLNLLLQGLSNEKC